MVSALLVAGLAVLPGTLAPAVADDYGDCNTTTGCKPDDHSHDWCRGGSWSGYSNLANIIAHEMQDLEDETSFSATFEGDCGSGTDIKFLVELDPKSWQGLYQCQDKDIWGDCDDAIIWLRPKSMSTQADRHQTACHEIGHSGGLQHHGSSYGDCMASTTSPVSNQLYYDGHHRNDHLNPLE